MAVAQRIERKLREEFSPQQLEIIDESEDHRGHGGWREGGETHFRVVMHAPALAELSRVARQRAVMQTLREELAGPVHALALSITV